LDKAIAYSQRNPRALIIVSGAQGPQESITEALAMERYLINHGVAPERIIKEESATSTYENMMFSKELLDGILANPYTAVVITNDFHIYRASQMAKKTGLNATHLHAKIDWYAIPQNYLRECLAVVKFWVIGR
jgi:uncharacterized SAM-binding protein YcdF (DUF218 family)